MDKAKQIIVLVVNILSPKRNQVNIGKITKPALEPMNLAVQTEPVASETYFQPYQNKTLVGTPTRIAESIALSDHQSYIFCRLSWYQPIIWPKRKKRIPMRSFITGL